LDQRSRSSRFAISGIGNPATHYVSQNGGQAKQVLDIG
jgi:hypothetical protein